MPISDYYNWLHGKATPTVGVDIGHSGSEYSEDELDTERTYPGIGKAGPEIGLHVLVNEAFTAGGGFTSADISIAHGAATSPTTLLVSRNVLIASLVAGAHVFVGIPPGVELLRYVRGYFAVNGGNPAAGQVCMWLGPRDGSENT